MVPAAVLVAATLSCGWPHTDVALAIFIGWLLLHGIREGGWKGGVPLVLAAASGGLIAAPSLLPLVAYHAFTVRSAIFLTNAWSVPLSAFAAVGFPMFYISWFTFIGSVISSFPIVYINWLIPFVLIKARYNERHLLQDEYVRFFGAMAYVFLLLCMMPTFTTLRWSFRFLPMFGLALAVMTARLLTVREVDGLFGTGWDRRIITLSLVPAVVLGLFVLGIVHSASIGRLTATGIVEVGLLALLAVAITTLARRRPAPAWLYASTLSHIVVFAGIIAVWPTNPFLPRWKVPTSQNALPEAIPSTGNILFLWSRPASIHSRFTSWTREDQPTPALLIGQSPLLVGYHAINGYSPLSPVSVSQFFPFEWIGSLTPSRNPLPRLFSKEPNTEKSYADLMRVDSIVAEGGGWTARAETDVPSSWQRRVLNPHRDTLFHRSGAFISS